MSVYVDDMKAPFQRMVMCHMIADSEQELYAMARTIGVSEQWVQDRGTYRVHFDICQSKRVLAVKFGAKEVSLWELAQILVNRKASHGASNPKHV